MWVDIPGESHSAGYRNGCQLLSELDHRFAVSVTEGGSPEPYTSQHLRISRATWGDVSHDSGWIYNYGEEDWFTNETAVQRTKNHLTYANNNNNLKIAAMGFAWCWDMVLGWQPSAIDPIFNVQWWGQTGLADGSDNGAWGLDSGILR